jgi:catechol 2,3-dioxygenase-like lactoylglutathione lyase family enzyme
MVDERPAVWVGHVAMKASDPARTHDFFVAAGMTSVHRGDDFAITELRGGTHLIIQPGATEPGDAPFDLMVDDLVAFHRDLRERDVDVSDIVAGDIHDAFVITDPDGQRVVVCNSHVVGPV